MAKSEITLESIIEKGERIWEARRQNSDRLVRLESAEAGLKLEQEALETVRSALNERKQVHDRESSAIDEVGQDVIAMASSLVSDIGTFTSMLSAQRKEEDSSLARLSASLSDLTAADASPDRDDEPGG